MAKEQAIVYCQGAFSNPTLGKTARGLVRFTDRYEVLSVIDNELAGCDSGEYLDEIPNHIPILANLKEALRYAKSKNQTPSHFIIGIAPKGGIFRSIDKQAIKEAIQHSLNIDNGLHDFLTEDNEIVTLAKEYGITLRDIRASPPRNQLHMYSGKINEVTSYRIAVLGTDSAIGKRTTSWLIVKGLQARGISAELIGTGQTAWLQGAKYTVMRDALINDFSTGELEHAVYRAYKETKAQILVIEGQGSLFHPAYHSGGDIIVATKPDAIVLQHAPAREFYVDTEEAIHPLSTQIQALEILAQKPIIAISINHENLSQEEMAHLSQEMYRKYKLPVSDVLWEGADSLVDLILNKYQESKK